MSLREKTMEVIPCDVPSCEQRTYARGHLPPHVGLERFLVLVMFKLRGGAGRLLSGAPKRITLGSWRAYNLLRFLIPPCGTRCVRPTMFCFKKACRGIESQPTERWRMGSVRYGVNFVQHDVDMKVLLVVVSDDHVQMFVEPKCFSVCTAASPTLRDADVRLVAMPVRNGTLHRGNAG